MKERQSGVLMHISSLPGKYGIGSFGQSAYDFVDFLVRTKQRYWQILPLGTTSYGDSPYQSFSAFAGNTHFIDMDLLIAEGLLTEADLAGVDFGSNPQKVDYAKIFKARRPLLEKAAANFLQRGDRADYQAFVEANQTWLEIYAEYMAIKEYFGLKAWTEWPDADARLRRPEAIAAYREQLAEQLTYHRVSQYFFFKQWLSLKAYANERQIEIVGDMPIYVAADSCDVWAQPHFFKTDAAGRPTCVAGCPPDEFSETGQLWGNPIYDWEAMDRDGYRWWIERLRESFKIYDIVRIDHFRGFESYWEIPAEADTAAPGKWVKGPGYKLFAAVKEALGDLNIIAEDLGFMTEEVIELRERTGFPGMKILQFAFNPNDESIDSPHLASNNSVMYTGTHDNNTVLGWYQNEIKDEVREYMAAYTNRREYETVPHAMLRTIFASVSFMAIATMQDLLELGSEARMNYPSTIGGNWDWRMTADQLNPIVEGELYRLTKTYRRLNRKLLEKQN
ncbi:4-alpha-glucanotransferase [Streptococcus panodentis]|uniref:4-alpha-glucanotransferase n=1 Tax=Streptococcus panodentis TaxID=1581472 RepID=A0ABS5AZQ8_9STRE|nr:MULTISPECIES: 4-alpha-glucanotransferase [Streptococcus]MBP2622044.1 4-alpha-glucanotransferase [Streptococcus panodentis]